MSLRKIDEQGNAYEVEAIPYKQHFDRNWRCKFGPGEESTIKDFLRSKIYAVDKFSVGSMFPKNVWTKQPELMRIYEVAGKSELQAAYFLGLLVMEILIECYPSYLTTKTVLGERDIATAFYWKAA